MAKREFPKWQQGDDYKAGMKAYELAMTYQAVLQPRLPGGLLQGLKEDLDSLAMAGGENKTKVAGVKGYTGTQGQALEEAAAWCSAIRENLKRSHAPTDVQKAAGVGTRFTGGKVGGAIAALNAILQAYDRFPDAFREAGLLPEDMTTGKTLLAALAGAEAAQESAIGKKSLTTAARNARRKRIEAAVDRIIGIAAVAFVKDPSTAALFRALIPNHAGGGTTPPTGDQSGPKPPVSKA
jgi:hypothetical protein